LEIIFKKQTNRVFGKKCKQDEKEVSTGSCRRSFFCKLEAYIDIGLENEDFYGWGIEDGERYYEMNIDTSVACGGIVHR
jgi:hypothetical protein